MESVDTVRSGARRVRSRRADRGARTNDDADVAGAGMVAKDTVVLVTVRVNFAEGCRTVLNLERDVDADVSGSQMLGMDAVACIFRIDLDAFRKDVDAVRGSGGLHAGNAVLPRYGRAAARVVGGLRPPMAAAGNERGDESHDGDKSSSEEPAADYATRIRRSGGSTGCSGRTLPDRFIRTARHNGRRPRSPEHSCCSNCLWNRRVGPTAAREPARYIASPPRPRQG